MKKNNVIAYAGVALITAAVLGGAFVVKNMFFKPDKAEEKQLKGEYSMKALYLENQTGDFLFVDLTNETPFMGTIPEGGVYNEKEEMIAGEDLESGDVVSVWGNGVVAQSYPAQYNGITKIQVEEKDSQKEKEYSHYLEEFFPKADMTKVPTLDISYAQPDALVTAVVSETGTYQWTYQEEGQEETTTAAEGDHVLQMGELADISIEGQTKAELLFSVAPEKTEVFRWTKEEWEKEKQEKSAADIPEGESVAVTENQAGNPEITCDAGYVYLIKGYWENGEAEYGFFAKEI